MVTALVASGSGATILAALLNGIRMYRKPAPPVDMAEVWQSGGPL
jgi:hypothetical protein